MRQYALISVWNKDSVDAIARAFVGLGYELLATGKTKIILQEAGFQVTEVSELTGEPERFDGRLKTLHHKILGGILFRPGQDEPEWPFDFRIGAVVCNFYPFEDKVKEDSHLESLLPWVDIGGPNMVRAGAKNFEHVWVLTRPEQYTRFIASMDKDQKLRERFALEAFELVADYSRVIADSFQTSRPWDSGGELRYGENPHQKAFFVSNRKISLKSFGSLSYNNVRDAEAALRFVTAFERPTAAVVKHQTLCGAGQAWSSRESSIAFRNAWEGDPVSRYGGVVALNFFPEQDVLEILQTKFIEVLVLPMSDRAQSWAADVSTAKPKLKILLLDQKAFSRVLTREVWQGRLGRLEQESDSIKVEARSPEEAFVEFGQWTAACSKSNAMTLCHWDQRQHSFVLIGAGQGQPNRVDALALLALPRAKAFCEKNKIDLKGAFCFSDAFLPFSDCLDVLHRAGVQRLYQPGGSKSDEDVMNRARELGIDMRITNVRHFWH